MQQTENYGLTIYEPNDVTSYLTAQGWNGTMQKIDSAMKAIQTEATTNATDIAALESQTSTNNEQISDAQADIKNLETESAGNSANIAGLTTRVTNLEKAVTDLESKESTENYYTSVLSKGEKTLATEIGTFKDSSLIDIYSSIYGVDPLTIELRAATTGQPNLCVTTWDAQLVDMNVAVKITNLN